MFVFADAPTWLLFALFALALYAATRFFRADGETEAPRPWWQVFDRAQEALNLMIYLTALTVINLLWSKRELDFEVIAIYLVSAGFSFYNYRKLKELEKTEPKHSSI